MTPEGIETGQGFFPLDVIVYATGFDAMTGSLNRIDIKGFSEWGRGCATPGSPRGREATWD